ncbi:MAG: transcriptional regulator, partial [Clostridia bacterium]|nr:transcriptional regulator [Clostridia bacterium]
QRGAQGGYTLTHKCDGCTMGDIIRTMEGEITGDYIDDGAAVNDFWDKLYKVLNDYMDSVTLNDIIENKKIKNGAYEYYI